MDNKELLEYNELCAAFLDWYYENGSWFKLQKFRGGVVAVKCCDKLEFNSDWNSIMQIIDAIEQIGYKFNISHQDCLIEEENSFIIVKHTIKDNTKKQMVIQAIRDFLILHKNNKIKIK